MTKARFRAIAIANLLLLPVLVTALLVFEQQLPAALDAWQEEQLSNEFNLVDLVGFGIAIVAVSANVGLCFFARWSRPAFVASIVGATVVILFAGPTVEAPLESFLYDVTMLLDGFIIALAYFSDARTHFHRKVT